jgi:predicted small secreted protein
MRPFIMMCTAFFLVASLSACGNTVVGIGQDIQTMGENIMKEEKVVEK